MPTVNLDRMTLLSFIIPREHRQIANVSLNRVRNIIEMNLFYIFFILMFMFYVSGGDTYLWTDVHFIERFFLQPLLAPIVSR